MKLFLVDVITRTKILEALVHAEDAEAARAHLRSKFPRCELQNARELGQESKHFIVGEADRT